MIFVKQQVDIHFDETRDDIAELDSDCPSVIKVGNFGGDWDEAVQKLIKQTQLQILNLEQQQEKILLMIGKKTIFQMGI